MAGTREPAHRLASPPREATDHARAGEPGHGGERGRAGRGRAQAVPRLADLVRGRRRGDRGELHAEVLVFEPHRVREGVGVGVVHPALDHPLEAVAAAQEDGVDHLSSSGPSRVRLRRRLLVTTDTDDDAIAAPARIGESRIPQSG